MKGICFALLLPLAVFSQSAADAPAFEVASVKSNKSGSERAPSTILPGGRFTATNNTLRALILNAYGIWGAPYLLSGGPSWIDSEAFDVDAKAAAGAIPAGTIPKELWEKTRLMLRALLADRFQLVVQKETKEMPIYELSVAKNGPKLKKSDRDCSASHTACHGFSGGARRLTGVGVDMFDIAMVLGSHLDRPVVDKTGISGLFDMEMRWNPFAEAREGIPPDIASLPTIFAAVQEQLGLQLDSRKGPVEVYVITHVERPSGN